MAARGHAKLFTGALSPVTFYRHSEAFLEAAEREFEAGDHISLPGYFLVSRAGELALKAYMLATGAAEEDLRRISHDLELSLEACEGAEIPEAAQAVLRMLNPYYSGKDLEYPKTGFKSYPDRSVAIKAVRGILEAVKPKVWAAGRIGSRRGQPALNRRSALARLRPLRSNPADHL